MTQDEMLAELRAITERIAARSAPESLSDPGRDPDPCARLGVKPLAGGMPDAPIVKHDKYRMRRTCVHRHECGCEKTYLPDHRDTYGICMCAPVDVDAHYEAAEGVRVKGIAGPRKMLPKERSYLGSHGTALGSGKPTGELMVSKPAFDRTPTWYAYIGPKGRVHCAACCDDEVAHKTVRVDWNIPCDLCKRPARWR
jgi:hypothetical protein